MRKFSEPTAKNLLREPLIFGVPFPALIGLSLVVLILQIGLSGLRHGNTILLAVALTAYAGLRIASRFAKTGWLEQAIFLFERRTLEKRIESIAIAPIPAAIQQDVPIFPPDTLEHSDLVHSKAEIVEAIASLKPGERLIYFCEKDESGSAAKSLRFKGSEGSHALEKAVNAHYHFYSLHSLPTRTDPLWLFSVLSRIDGNFQVIASFKGLNPAKIKSRIEASRRRNARAGGLSAVDSDVTFEEASLVLEGISRGDECVVEASLLILAETEADLDSRHFCKEQKKVLALWSVLGLRPRFHRSHFVRAVTASDLVPNILDPEEADGTAILETVRGTPLYFNPQDPRLEALHWLVVGASGSGKSFFTGLVLKRLLEKRRPMSVLFIDHNRSFRRLVRSDRVDAYIEPSSFFALKREFPQLMHERLNEMGACCGLELSDLPTAEKKTAIRYVLQEIEAFLRTRETLHVVYIVLDECWAFLRDEPELVQRAFREFRKLNGAAIAITQSLSDFLTDESGRSIFQNAPIRILLRQGEDLTPYRSVLGLNEVELTRLRLLRQKKGEYAECLIKTPFLSRLGRLYPTQDEHELLRTDNIREEIIRDYRFGPAELQGSLFL